MTEIDIPTDNIRVSFKDDIDLTKPVAMLLAVAEDGVEPNVWYAPQADRLAPSPETARYLEEREAVRAEQSSPEATATRQALRDARSLIAAETIPADEWKGWVCDGEETYAGSVEELVENLIDMGAASPSYCYVTTAKGFDFDLEDAIETYLMDEHHEDAECRDLPKLIDFFNEWKKTETVTTYWPGSTIVVIDAARFADEIAAARALVAEAEAAA
jgi:hypothetical protein